MVMAGIFFSFLFIYTGISSFKATNTNKIARSSINHVQYEPGRMAKRDHIIVNFSDKKGRTQNRTILMPDALSPGKIMANRDAAIKAFKDAGIYVIY